MNISFLKKHDIEFIKNIQPSRECELCKGETLIIPFFMLPIEFLGIDSNEVPTFFTVCLHCKKIYRFIVE